MDTTGTRPEAPAVAPHRAPRYLLTALVGLSLLDLWLTWLLLKKSGSGVYEANPLAAAILGGHGWIALTGFKLACTAVALVACWLVWRLRPIVGRRLLFGICALLLAVNTYSAALLCGRLWHPDLRALAEAEDARQDAALQWNETSAYMTHLDGLAAKLGAGEVSLAHATIDLKDYLTAMSCDPLGVLRVQHHAPDLAEHAFLAAVLVRKTGMALNDYPLAIALHLPELIAEYETLHGRPLPDFALETFRRAYWASGAVVDTAGADTE